MTPKPTYKELKQKIAGLEERLETVLKTDSGTIIRNAYLEHILQTNMDAIVIYDNALKIQMLNKVFTVMFGYIEEEAIGHCINDLIVPSDDLENSNRLSIDARNGEKTTAKAYRVKKDGSMIYISVVVTPIFASCEPVGYYAVYTDIKKEKKEEQEILLLRSYMENLFESAPEAIAMSDINHKLVNINSEFTRLFGYKPKEAIGKQIDELIVPKAYIKEAHDITLKMEEGNKIVLDGIRKRKDESLVPVSVLACPIIINNERVGHYGIYRDITTQKNAEIALHESERLRGVLELAGAVCHELNQPLMAILGNSELLLINITKENPLYKKLLKLTSLTQKLGKINRKLMNITKYETKDYLEGQIIDIDKSTF